MNNFQEINKFTNKHVDTINTVAGLIADGAEKMFAGARNFSATACRNQADLISKLVSAKTLSEAMVASTEHAKAQYDASIGETRRLGDIFTDLAAGVIKSASSEVKAEAGKPTPAKAPLAEAVPGVPSGAPRLVKSQPRAHRGAA